MSLAIARRYSASSNVRLNLAGNPAIFYETVRSEAHIKVSLLLLQVTMFRSNHTINQQAFSEGRSVKVVPKYTVFPLHLNEHVDCSLATLGVVNNSKTKMEFVTSTGDVVVVRFTRASEQRWKDSKWIKDLNNWRSMNVKRRLSPNGEKVMDYGRPRWSVTEFNSLKKLILERVAMLGRDLDTENFDTIRIQHNKRWEGVIAPKGSETITGKILKAPQKIAARTTNGIRAL
jgi:hypothetical protein